MDVWVSLLQPTRGKCMQFRSALPKCTLRAFRYQQSICVPAASSAQASTLAQPGSAQLGSASNSVARRRCVCKSVHRYGIAHACGEVACQHRGCMHESLRMPSCLPLD